jgi:hypothetical protein
MNRAPFIRLEQSVVVEVSIPIGTCRGDDLIKSERRGAFGRPSASATAWATAVAVSSARTPRTAVYTQCRH